MLILTFMRAEIADNKVPDFLLYQSNSNENNVCAVKSLEKYFFHIKQQQQR